MPPITLPQVPKGKDFEDLISALFIVGGNFIERGIEERGETTVLELDVVSTSYSERRPQKVLIEAKSGEWGFPDIFKLFGMLNYLEIPKGHFVTQSTIQGHEFRRKKCEHLNINLVAIENIDLAAESLGLELVDPAGKKGDLETLRFSFWLERKFISQLGKLRKQSPTSKGFKAIWEYYNAVNNDIFFDRGMRDKFRRLFIFYLRHPNITAKLGSEMLGGDFESPVQELEKSLFEKTYYQCESNPIQICTFIEHRARLALLKNAVDFILEAPSNQAFENVVQTLLGSSMHNSFLNGMREIKDDPFLHLYPLFWQWYTWVFGGFILLDRETEEIELLSKKTGIPKEHIQAAFDAYDKLFPISGGWQISLEPNSRIQIMKHFPTPLRGIGANYRRLTYCADENFDTLYTTLVGTYTANDLSRWNNSAYDVLTKW